MKVWHRQRKSLMSRILITYGSRTESTRQIASFMEHIIQAGRPNVEVDVLSVKEIHDYPIHWSRYDAAIIGTATRLAKPLPEVVQFVRDHVAELRKIPTAYFIVSLTLREDTPENRATVRKYLDPLVAVHPPVEIGMFAGRFDPALVEQPLRFFATHGKTDLPRGDFRNWDAIRAWTEAVTHQLLPVSS